MITNQISRVVREILLNRRMQAVLDTSALLAGFCIAYLLRFEFTVSASVQRALVLEAPVAVVAGLVAMQLSGVRAFIWRYFGAREALRLWIAVGVASIPLAVLRLVGRAHFAPPWSVILLNALIAGVLLIGLRLGRRLQFERGEVRGKKEGVATGENAILVGAGRAGVTAMRELRGRGLGTLNVVGFVDDDPEKHGLVVEGVRVLGMTRDLPNLAREHDVKQVIVTIAGQAFRKELRRIVALCDSVSLRVRVIPGLFDLLEGRVSVNRLRDVEIDDLLGRESVRVDDEARRTLFRGSVVAITGAGGSIGSELTRQVAALEPGLIVLVERSEPALFQAHRQLIAAFPGIATMARLADIADRGAMRRLLTEVSPRVILHAAAHKHVPLMEDNPLEAFRNNSLGTYGLASLAGELGVDVFVLVSTDKAVRPTSVMGTSKRVAELAVQSLQSIYPKTSYAIVRFGNVLGSAGSVIPIFREQIQRGGPVTVTDPEMVRFFMTIPEASQLVTCAAALAKGGEVFILDMGDPVRIVDLATQMIRLCGLRPGEDIDIVFSGIRPGEKLYEELRRDEEHLGLTKHPKILVVTESPRRMEVVRSDLSRLERAVERWDLVDVRRIVPALVPEHQLTDFVVGDDSPIPRAADASVIAARAMTAHASATLP